MPFFTDQTGRIVPVPDSPARIVSLVPSQTELLYDLGLESEVVGITKFCIHPAHWFRSKTRIGGTKQLRLELIRELQPDLILANQEENEKDQVEELARQFPVWVSRVKDLQTALEMIVQVGKMTGREQKAGRLAAEIASAFGSLLPASRPLRAAYLIWKDPWMSVGGDTFIHAMLQKAGFENVFADRLRYPVIRPEELQELGCEVVFLSSEPYPFREQHLNEMEALLPGKRVLIADGEIFSWYGSRMLRAPAYFNLLRQQLMP
jgi:ABC-type Fe3+-hydroxamate transport system substrate-binding protein